MKTLIQGSLSAIIHALNYKIEEGDYTVTLELNGILTYIHAEGYRFSYFNGGVQILSSYESLNLSPKALQLLTERIAGHSESSERIKYEALKSKFEPAVL